MTQAWTFEPGPIHLLRAATGSDLVGTITDFAVSRSIEAATLTYLGAVRRASLRYYDQDAKEYRDFVDDRHLEVLAGVGNVSLLDGVPFVHTHAVFGDDAGRAFGGHVNVGCEVFALEVTVRELRGEAPVRLFDDVTGLTLWGGC